MSEELESQEQVEEPKTFDDKVAALFIEEEKEANPHEFEDFLTGAPEELDRSRDTEATDTELEAASEGEDADDILDEVDDEEGDPAEGIETEGAQKRIRSLAAQRKEARAEAEATRQQLQQQQQMFEQRLSQMQQQQQYQQQQQMQQAQQQQAILQRQLEVLNGRGEKERLSEMSPLERHEHEILQKAKRQSEELARAQLAPLEQRLQAEQQARQQAEQKWQSQQRFQKYQALTEQARREHVLQGFDDTAAQDLAQETDDFIMAMSAAYGIPPEKIAPKARKFLDRYAVARHKAIATQSKKTTQKGRNVPSAGASRAPAKGRPRPKTMQELRDAGFEDFLDFNASNLPTE